MNGIRVNHLPGKKKKNKSNAIVKYIGNKKSITLSILLRPVGMATNDIRYAISKITRKKYRAISRGKNEENNMELAKTPEARIKRCLFPILVNKCVILLRIF